MVINTVLSVLAYDYPPEKLNIYLSDDGGSIFTFFALLEALQFAKHWIPFCKKFRFRPMSPALFFSKASASIHDPNFSDLIAMEKMYKDMESRIEAVAKSGGISKEVKSEHEGFSEWLSITSSEDHQAIVKILVDGRDRNARDSEGFSMPTIVYMAREKRLNYIHNFKAGALNALLRVSEQISNGPVILTIDCDMCANNAGSIRDALCFFMDEDRGHEYAFVQFPQAFQNLSKNDLYASSFKIVHEVYFPGLDGQGGPMYTGSCCFHRRECLIGRIYNKQHKIQFKDERRNTELANISYLEERAKNLANCNYEENTQWGKEVGLKYGCPVEDVISGFSIHCRGWKSAYFIPSSVAFLGLAPTTLSQALVQLKRWSEGYFQILISKYCPFLFGFGKTKLGLQMGYSICCLWALGSIPTLIYVAIPSIGLLNGVLLFPSVSSLWFIAFAFVIAFSYAVGLWESLTHGLSLKCWWNELRMELYRRSTSDLLALVDTIMKILSFTDSVFVITPKVADEEAAKRYENEIMEFGSSSPLFIIILSTLAFLNLLCLIGGVGKVISEGVDVFSSIFLQFFLCASLVFINFPIYEASFFRRDNGCIPMSTTLSSVAIVIVIYFIFVS